MLCRIYFQIYTPALKQSMFSGLTLNISCSPLRVGAWGFFFGPEEPLH